MSLIEELWKKTHFHIYEGKAQLLSSRKISNIIANFKSQRETIY